MAAIVDVSNGRIRSARLAFGGLAHQPWRVAAAEAALAGASTGKAGVNGSVSASASASANAAADLVLVGARGFGHNDFKIPLLRRTLGAVLTET